MFNPLLFIYPYNPTDKAIRIIDNNGRIVYTINVCSYQKAGVSGSTLSIILEDATKEFKIVFDSNNEAKQGLLAFKQAIDTLRPNCEQTTGGGAGYTPQAAPISITYLEYKALQTANQLVVGQLYDVTDSTNSLFDLDPYVIRVTPLSINDRNPKGVILSTGAFVTIDTANDMVSTYEDLVKKNFILNSDANLSTFTNSTNVTVLNGGSVTATNSDHIIAENGSTIVATSCTLVKAVNNSTIQLQNGQNVSFDNIQMNLMTLPFNLTNVNIDRNVSVGKAGRTTIQGPGPIVNLNSYLDTIEQDYVVAGNSNAITINLDNKITQAGARFKIRYLGAGKNNVIKIQDAMGQVLYTIKDNDKGNTILCDYNLSTNLFVVSGVQSASSNTGVTVQFASITNNQIYFFLDYPVSNGGELQMFVNGQKQINGLDFSYDVNLSQVVWANRKFNLGVGDEVEFKVY